MEQEVEHVRSKGALNGRVHCDCGNDSVGGKRSFFWRGRSFSDWSVRLEFEISLRRILSESSLLLRMFSGAFTFTPGQALIYFTTPQIFGAAAIQFERPLQTMFSISRGCGTPPTRYYAPYPLPSQEQE